MYACEGFALLVCFTLQAQNAPLYFMGEFLEMFQWAKGKWNLTNKSESTRTPGADAVLP